MHRLTRPGSMCRGCLSMNGVLVSVPFMSKMMRRYFDRSNVFLLIRRYRVSTPLALPLCAVLVARGRDSNQQGPVPSAAETRDSAHRRHAGGSRDGPMATTVPPTRHI